MRLDTFHQTITVVPWEGFWLLAFGKKKCFVHQTLTVVPPSELNGERWIVPHSELNGVG